MDPVIQTQEAPGAETHSNSEPIQAGSELFSELDKLAQEPEEIETSTAEPKQEKKVEPPKQDNSNVDPNKTPKDDVKVEKDAVRAEAPKTAKELRTAYEDARKNLSTLEASNTTLKAELETIKKSAPKDDPERKRLTEELQATKARMQQVEDEIKYLNYEKSTEYKEQYQAPVEKAFRDAYADLEQLVVEDPEKGTRVATPDDFAVLLRLPLRDAVLKAKEMFGETANEVLSHRRKIIELNQKKREAVENFKKTGAEREKQSSESQRASQEKAKAAWDDHNKTVAEKYPAFFAPEEGDEEGNKILDAGIKLADLAFNPPEGTDPIQIVKTAAEIRNRAAGFGRMVHRNKRLQGKIKELEKTLEEYKKSDPGHGAPSGNKPAAGDDDTLEGITSKLDQLAEMR